MPLLRIDIAASFAQFQDAMSAIERSAKKTGSNLQNAFKGVNGVLAGLGVSVSVGALASLVKSSIDAADHLNDLSKKTGVTVDVLGGIGFAAVQAGGDLDSMAAAAGKLNKTIAEAGSGNKDALDAFKSLGISVEDASGRLKTVDKVLPEIADKFANFADGPEKAALALRFFSKAGADLIPLLDEGGEALRQNIAYYQKYSGVTQDIAEKSDAFNDQLEKVRLLSKAAGNNIASELLPTLSQLAAKFIEVKEKGDGFSGVAKTIGTAFKGVVVVGTAAIEIISALGDNIGAMIAVLGRLNNFDFKGAANVLGENIDQRKKQLTDFKKFAEGVFSGQVADTGPSKPAPIKPPAPRLPSSAPDGLKQRLDGRLRDLERQNDAERELLATRNEFLQDAYQKDLIAIGDYYAARKAASDEALAAQVANITEEIDLLSKRASKDSNEAAQNESKINELIQRRATLQQRTGLDAIRSLNDQAEAAKELQRALEDVNTELLEQQGKSGEAAARRFDDRNRQLRQRLETELAESNSRPDADGVTTVRGSRGLVALDKLRDITIAQAKLNEIQDEGQRIQSDLAIASERAALAAQNGSISELESLRKVSDARAQAAVDLKAVADAYAEMAVQTGNPALVQRAKEMQVEVEKLANSADLVRDKFQDVFQNGFESFFDKLLSGTASIKDALKALVSDVATDFAKIGIRDLGQQLLGKEGALGGLVDTASKFFGGEAASPVADAAKAITGVGEDAASVASTAALTSLAGVTAATDASMVTLAASTISTDVAMVALTASATTAAAALATVAATSAAGGAGGVLGFLDDFASFAANGNVYNSGNIIPFAKGGMPNGIVDTPTYFGMSGGRTGLMGEAGPEAIMPLGRDKHGDLAVRMLNSHGGTTMLPLTRDSAGRLSVRASNDVGPHQKFAKGGVPGFRIPDINRASVGAVASMAVPVMAGDSGTTNNIKVNVPDGTSTADANKIASQTAVTLTRHQRRNM